MYSVVAFFITLVEVLIVGCGWLLQSTNLFYVWLIYGSPFYLISNIFNNESALLDRNPLYLAMLCFHILKYTIIFRAQIIEERTFWRIGAVLMEAGYLCLSAYFLL